MDYYLNEDNCYKRLEDEYYKYGKLIICLDFDNTIYDYHDNDNDCNKMIELLKRWQNHADIIIFTSSDEKDPECIRKIDDYCKRIGLSYNGINIDSCVKFGGRKPYANVYVDDRGGLPSVYNNLLKLIEKIEHEELYVRKEEFLPSPVKYDCIRWIRKWFDNNGPDCNAIVGISGGKDSTVVAALCVKALGKDRVIGVMMPNGKQKDIADAKRVCEVLNIKNYTINIKQTVNTVYNNMRKAGIFISDQTMINLPARIRMATLYAVSQSNNGRVANTCNLSEDWIGYSTRYGDSVGDFSPLSKLTVDEVKQIGYDLNLPKELIDKKPSDGLCGMSDEDKIGFSYKVLDKYIRTGICDDEKIKNKIDLLHRKNQFKLKLMPVFEPFEN